MRGRLAIAAIVLFSTFCAYAQEDDRLWIEARWNFDQEFSDGKWNGEARADFLNLQLSKHFSDKFYFRFRQRLVNRIDFNHDILSATDFLWLTWKATPKLSFTLGKQPIFIGGYEYDAPPIDVYYWGKFCLGLRQYYAPGISADYEVSPGQHIAVQFAESSLVAPYTGKFSYNIEWSGKLFPWWNTLWSMNILENEDRGNLGIVSLGNRMIFGPLAVDLDFINRASRRQKNYLSDWSAITKIIYNVGHFDLCSKAGYEKNAAENVDADGLTYDITVPAGEEYIYAGAGIEFFPLKERNLRLHLAYYWDSDHDHRHNVVLGVTYKFTLTKL